MIRSHIHVLGFAIGFCACFLWGMATGEIKTREDKWFLTGAFMCLLGLGMTLAW